VQRESVFAAILLFALAAAAVTAAEVKFREPTGYGKAKFGMSAAQVKKLYPKLEPAKATAEAAGNAQQLLAVYFLEDQRVGPLKQCKVEFRFYKDELYEIQFRCPDRAGVGDYLQKTYGMPNQPSGNAVFWMGEHSAVSLAPRSGAFAYADRARSQAFQAILYKYMMNPLQTPGGTPPAGAATPAATAPETPAHQ
jgi:hypothetical protein